MKEPLLNEHELQEGSVAKIVEYFDNRLLALDKKNRNKLDPVDTAAIRGAIEEVSNFKKRLKQDRKAPATQHTDSMSG